MSLKSALGLDFFDISVHLLITGMAMVVVDSFAPRGGVEDALMAATVAGSMLILAVRRNRNRGKEQLPVDDERVAVLEDRIAELEAASHRVMELEERLDFTERMLAQHREAQQLGRGERT